MVKVNLEFRNKFNLFIWKSKDGEYIFLEESFNHKDWMSGLTGNSFEFHTEMQKNEMDDDYLYDSDGEYLFCEYIKNMHDYNTSFNDWVEMCKDEHPNGVAYDDSYCDEEWLQEAMKYASEQEGYDYEYSDCRGGWRMFNEENIQEDYYEYFIPENLKKLQEQYREYENSWNQD